MGDSIIAENNVEFFSFSTQAHSTMNGYTAAVLAPLHSLLWAPQSPTKGVPLSPDLSWFEQSELDEMPSPSETESDEEMRLKSDAKDDLETEDDVSIASSFLCQQTFDYVYTALIFKIFTALSCVI